MYLTIHTRKSGSAANLLITPGSLTAGVIVQIYSFTHPTDVTACVEASVDHIGVVGGNQDLPAAVSNDRARSLFELVPDSHRTVALTVATDVDTITAYAKALQPDILHLSSATAAVSPDAMQELETRLTDIDLMKAIDVTGDAPLEAAQQFAAVSDWLILDSVTDDVAGVGAAGVTHDWSVSRRIVDAVDTPVILAGGLSPENVGAAIRAVEPAGVDSYTHTSRSETRKDIDRVVEFVDRAHAATSEQSEELSP